MRGKWLTCKYLLKYSNHRCFCNMLLTNSHAGHGDDMPVPVLWGMSFPPFLADMLVSLMIFLIYLKLARVTGLSSMVWHSTLFNAAVWCYLLYLTLLILRFQ